MARKKKGKGFAMGALLGGLLGGLTALLLAPKEGKRLRKEIGEKCKEVSLKTYELIDDLCERSTEVYEDVKDKASKFINRSKQ